MAIGFLLKKWTIPNQKLHHYLSSPSGNLSSMTMVRPTASTTNQPVKRSHKRLSQTSMNYTLVLNQLNVPLAETPPPDKTGPKLEIILPAEIHSNSVRMLLTQYLMNS